MDGWHSPVVCVSYVTIPFMFPGRFSLYMEVFDVIFSIAFFCSSEPINTTLTVHCSNMCWLQSNKAFFFDIIIMKDRTN
jgi:hypothetical protein